MYQFKVEGTCKNRGDVLLLLLFLGFELADAVWAMDTTKESCKLEFDGEEGEISFTPWEGGRVTFLLQANDEVRIRRLHAGLTEICRVRTVHWRKR
jgi:hypothetical protein